MSANNKRGASVTRAGLRWLMALGLLCIAWSMAWADGAGSDTAGAADTAAQSGEAIGGAGMSDGKDDDKRGADNAGHDPASMSADDRAWLRAKARARQQRELWNIRAEGAKARAAYHKAEAEADAARSGAPAPGGDDGDGDGDGDGDSSAQSDEDSGATRSLDEEELLSMYQRQQDGEASVEREEDVTVESIYGAADALVAQVTLDGTAVPDVEEGDALGTATVVRIDPTRIVLDRDGERVVVHLR